MKHFEQLRKCQLWTVDTDERLVIWRYIQIAGDQDYRCLTVG